MKGDLAVLLLRGDEKIKFNLTMVLLAGINEGDVVEISITKDAAATDEAKERVISLLRDGRGRGSEGGFNINWMNS